MELLGMSILAAGDIAWSEIVSLVAGATVPALVKFIRKLRASVLEILSELESLEQAVKELQDGLKKLKGDKNDTTGG